MPISKRKKNTDLEHNLDISLNRNRLLMCNSQIAQIKILVGFAYAVERWQIDMNIL